MPEQARLVVVRFGAGCRWWPRPGESRRAPPFLRATGLKLWWGRTRRPLIVSGVPSHSFPVSSLPHAALLQAAAPYRIAL